MSPTQHNNTSHPLSLGKFGEQLAARYLRTQGYILLHENWRAGRYGEIDIIAFDNNQGSGPDLGEEPGVLVFVEVKTRDSSGFGHPLESLHLKKRRQLAQLGERFLQTYAESGHPPVELIRFDVIGIEVADHTMPPQITHLRNAFDAGDLES